MLINSSRLTDSSGLIDISVPLHANLPTWPGDPPLCLERVMDVAQGDPASVSRLTLGSHTGTHVDAFSHFYADGKTLSEMDLNVYCGRCTVFEVPASVDLILPEHLTSLLNLKSLNITSFPRRILFKTRNSQSAWYQQAFQTNFVALSPEAAQWLIQQGQSAQAPLQLVGIDYLSIDSFTARNVPTHRALMQAGVYILEGLYLADVQPGDYIMHCLPLALHQGDGAPARVVLQPSGL